MKEKAPAWNPLLGKVKLPTDVVFHPSWWHRHTGITFDEDFFFHPLKRVEAEQRMERELYERFGAFGLGSARPVASPETGAVHLAAGFLLSEMLGCRVEYLADAPPQVICAQGDYPRLDVDRAFSSPAFKKLQRLQSELKSGYGYLSGDVNWGGILNLAMDLAGENILTDMFTEPDQSRQNFEAIAAVIEAFTRRIQAETGSSSISVNRTVRHLNKAVFLHSECSHTMISEAQYEEFLLPFDQAWSLKYRPFGVHYCGNDPHRHVRAFSKIPHLDFLDVGWGGDLKILREHLPDTFLNIRLDPVSIGQMSESEIEQTITRLVSDSGNPYLTGVCCINMDDQVADSKVQAVLETVNRLTA